MDFCIKGGTITLLTSTQWGKDDYEAVMKAYQETGFREDLTALLQDPKTIDSTRMLCALIQNGNLDLRVAVLRGEIYHQKKGYFEDEHGCVVAFDGSGNETQTALKPYDEGNAESFNIAWNWHEGLWSFYGKSWKQDLDQSLDFDFDSTFPVVRIQDLDPDFIDKWDVDINLESHREAARKRQNLLKKKWDAIYGSNKTRPNKERKAVPELHAKPKIILPDDLHNHQKKGVEAWKNAGRKGILEHATGSGKTITSLSVIKEHVNAGNHAIVLLPSDALLHQWEDEFDSHLPDVTKGMLGGGHHEANILDEMRISTGKGTVLLSSIQSFRGTRVQNKLRRLLGSKENPLLLVVDECHRIGAPSYAQICGKTFHHALGLSATPERQGDSEGTQRIVDLLGEPVNTYSLMEALEDNRLSPYDYHVHQVSLTDNEQKEYDVLRAKIRKAFAMKKKDEPMSEYLELMIYKSRRIIRGAENKIPKAIEIIRSEYHDGQHWLIYCEGEEMMNEIEARLRQETGAFPLRYWSGMDRFQRKKSLESFEKNGGIMLAIKCLDEGVDVPAISHGIVLSSSKTKREFIQRRGRMLRRSDGKEKAVIFDALALPNDYGLEVSFVLDEIRRAIEFAEGANNKLQVEHELTRIKIEFGISDEEIIVEPESDEDE